MPEQTIITTDQDTVIAEIDISAPPFRVFEALIDPDQLMCWFRGTDCPAKSWRMDSRVRGRYSYGNKQTKGVSSGVDKSECHGEITRFDPPRLLEYTWLGNWHLNPEHKTVVCWELTPTPSGTHVKVTHSGLLQEPQARADYSGGWSGVIDNLRKFVETGKV